MKPWPSYFKLKIHIGVNSPTLCGTLQADFYRPLRLPTVLIGDGQLGGISTTISSYESLKMKGYDIASIIMFHNPKYRNHEYLFDHFKGQIPIYFVPPPPSKLPDAQEDFEQLEEYYTRHRGVWSIANQTLVQGHQTRLNKLNDMPQHAREILWWPFTQHKLVDSVNVIDSAYKDDLVIYDPPSGQLKPKFDVCGSWWTQALGHGSAELAQAASYAAGRYGHVMYPESVHEPALNLAQSLLDTVGSGWASRVFYSDNGSTGIEVGLKMAMKYTENHYNTIYPQDKSRNSLKGKLKIIGLEGAYHGDTMGSMDAANPNHYNEQVHWYDPKGFWLDPPTIMKTSNGYNVSLPSNIQNDNADTALNSYEGIFDSNRDSSDLASIYRKHIVQQLNKAVDGGYRFGALVLEPVIMGAAGMLFVDPLFQRTLVNVVRELYPVPVLFDEVFTGFFRTGPPTASRLLNVDPDIAVFSKSLTGGLVPLSATLTNDIIFKEFEGPAKTDALLHGHSYTAYPIGCEVARKSIELYSRMYPRNSPVNTQPSSKWSEELVDKLISNPQIKGAFRLGTILVYELQDDQTSGYNSAKANKLLRWYHNHVTSPTDTDNFPELFIRPLGNRLYFMMSHITSEAQLKEVESSILKGLEHI
jgi:dethiobiotin synthetase/adenosylmethionine--8-amino-7-oxononanoate aminotransferase